MADTISIVIAVIAAIIAIVAIILVFVLPGGQGPTGATGTSNMSGFAKVVGNGLGSSTRAEPLTVGFEPTIPKTIKIAYSNATDLFNMVYANTTGIFTVASNGGGYYQINAENLIRVDLTISDVGITDIIMMLYINTVNIAQSQARVFFESGTQNSLVMLGVNWQGNLVPGDNISVDILVSSAYKGTMSYCYGNMTRLMMNGVTKFA
jgi:hypothetical protein